MTTMAMEKIRDDGKVFWEDIAIFGANYQSEMDKAYSDSHLV